MNEKLVESNINVISEGSRLEGRILLDQISRVHGTIAGELIAPKGSTLILSESSVVDGNIEADTLLIDGYVRGDILAHARVVVSGTGRVIGNIRTPSLKLEFGSYFEGRCKMDDLSEALTP